MTARRAAPSFFFCGTAYNSSMQPVEPTRRSGGRLKLFLGYAPGVGKSYAMLEAALQRQQRGENVVVAAASRSSGEAGQFLNRLTTFPLAADGGLDVDGLTALHPDLVVVDDLHRPNPPGARHPYRYQDVQDLLENGLEVYSALDIHHLESLVDEVFQITGYLEKQTVPDDVVDNAGVIELVDLPPEDLLQRFRAGQIAGQEMTASAAGKFYLPGNLSALRELAMRRAAGQVDAQMRAYMRAKKIPGPWAAGERLMVCISAHPMAERLIRAGRRLAGDLKADWVVVYVQTPERLNRLPAHIDRLTRAFQLAEQLGARVEQISASRVSDGILEYARQNNITKIMLGNPSRPRWHQVLFGSVVEELIRRSGQIGVYVISDDRGLLKPGLSTDWNLQTNWLRYLLVVPLVALITLISYPVHLRLDPTNLVMFYLLGVLAAAVYLGRGPSLLASFLSVIAFDYFLIEPRFSLTVDDTQYILTFLGLFIVGVVVSGLAGTVRDQMKASQQREAQTAALYALSRDLANQLDLAAVLQTVIEQIHRSFGRRAAVFLLEGNQLIQRAASPDFQIQESELPAAYWACQHARPAGSGTETMSGLAVRFQPLISGQSSIGVLAVQMDANFIFLPEQRQLLEAYCGLAALAIEHALLDEEVKRAALDRESEKLHTALLNSISHDLRTPLSAITGAFSSLYEAEHPGRENIRLDRATRMELIETGWEEAERLNRLVGNLLDMTRLEAGALRLHRTLIDVEEAVGAALDRLRSRLRAFNIETQIDQNLPPVYADALLFEQVLVNLLDNAAKYTPPGGTITLSAAATGSRVEVRVADTGRGLPPEDLERVFDKFYRAQTPDGPEGTGLGLSICKGIVEAHGGTIRATNQPGGGAEFILSMPAAENPPEDSE